MLEKGGGSILREEQIKNEGGGKKDKRRTTVKLQIQKKKKSQREPGAGEAPSLTIREARREGTFKLTNCFGEGKNP